MKLKTITLSIVALLCSAMLISCGNDATTQERSLQRVQLTEAVSASGRTHAAYPGQTMAQTTTDLSFIVMGTIEKILVKEGDYVRQGQLLASVDERDLRTQLSATEAEYAQIKAECERVIAMHEEQAVSDNDYDKARSGLEQITAKLTHHRDQLNDCALRAPYDGYIDRVYRSVKETAVPGTPVMTMFAAGGTDIVIYLPETEYERRNSIASIKASFSAKPNQQYQCKLRSLSRNANANQLYEARIVLAEEVEGITPGMSVMVDIDYAQPEQANNDVLVPIGCLLSEGQQSYVYVYNGGTVRRIAVTVSALKSNGMAVVSHGLREGDKVVSAGVHSVSDGQAVEPLQPSSDLNVGNLK